MDARYASLDDSPLIAADSLTFSYENSRADSLRVDRLQLPTGSLTVLCGVSGSGKSTFLHLLNGLIPDYYRGDLSGKLRVADLEAGQQSVEDLSVAVASVFQNPANQFFHKMVKHELVFPSENQGKPSQQILAQLSRLTQDFALEGYLERDLFSLSGGEKQRVALLTAIMLDTPIMVLDEPTANLDRRGIEQVREHLIDLKAQGKTILVAEHRLDYLRDLADSYLYFDQGRLQRIFSQAEFLGLSAQERCALSLRSIRLPEFKAATGFPFSEGLTVENLQLRAGSQNLSFIPRFSFPTGQITAIIGPNGAGKSTLAAYLAGLLDDDDARCELNGSALSAKDRLQKTALVMQEVQLQLFADSIENELKLGNHSSPEERAEILSRLGLAGMEERHPMTLSGGEQQRLLIASQILSDKEIFIFDEPSSGLDYRQMRAVAEVLQDLKRAGRIVILISHDEELLELTADQLLELTDEQKQIFSE